MISKILKYFNSRLFILYSQNNTITKKTLKVYYYQKLILNEKLNLEKKFRILTKNVSKLTNIFHKITNIKNENDFKNNNSIIIIKNYDKIVNILKRYFKSNILNEIIIFVFQNKIILNDNNYVYFD